MPQYKTEFPSIFVLLLIGTAHDNTNAKISVIIKLCNAPTYLDANLTISLLTTSLTATRHCTVYCCWRSTMKHCLPVGKQCQNLSTWLHRQFWLVTEETLANIPWQTKNYYKTTLHAGLGFDWWASTGSCLSCILCERTTKHIKFSKPETRSDVMCTTDIIIPIIQNSLIFIQMWLFSTCF